MTKEEAKSLLLQSVLYKTIAWLGILWIPATKLSNCSPNWELVMTLGAMVDYNAAVLILISIILFVLASSSKKKALKFLNDTSD